MKYLLMVATLMSSTTALSFDQSHKAWTELLKAHVKMSTDNTSSTVDYKNFDKNKLNLYLKTVSSVPKKEFNKFSRDQQLSFLINTYNAYTVKLILNNYPVKSIKKIGSFFSSPWKQNFFKLFGKETHLDQIEHTYTRASKTLGTDARIHFAFNCASIGCPALLDEAFTAEKLSGQLDSASKNFLKDNSRNRVNLSKKRVELSNIFKWYGDDFTDRNYKSLKHFLSTYVDSIAKNEKEKALLKSNDYSISYTGYDWDLNKK